MNTDLCLQRKDENLKVFYKDKLLFSHSPQHPAFTLSEVETDFRMHKRNVASYQLKNRIKASLPLNQITGMTAEQIEFDNLLTLTFSCGERLELVFSLKDNVKKAYNRLSISIPSVKHEGIYGCGEQFSYQNLKGKKVPMWTQEPGFAKNHSIYKLVGDLAMGAGGAWWTNYYPQALYVSSDNYFVCVESYAYCEFDFRKKDKTVLHINEIPRKIVIGAEDTPAKLLSALTSYLGRQRRLPDWIMDGAILGIGGGLDCNNPDSLGCKLQRALEGGVKTAAVWAEDWTGLRHFKAQTRLFWNWRYSQERYPDLPAYIKELKKKGIRFLGYNNCFLMYDSEIYEIAKSKGYLVKNKNGEPYSLTMFSFSAVMLDLTNPECRVWIKEIIKTDMIGAGLDGWMCDFAEYLPSDAQLWSGADPMLYHNEYPVLWAQVNHEAVQEAGRDTSDENAVVFFNRSGNLGTTRYSPLIWSGDQVMTFLKHSGLPAAVNSGISMGFSGVGYMHADVGGEFGMLWFRRTKELFMRWTEYATFTPIMRTHEAKGHAGWTLDSDAETLAHFAKFSHIHATMLPYLSATAEEYQGNGLPMIRHLLLHYGDAVVIADKHITRYQYLLGRDLLVAPVIKKRQSKRRLYLPDDNWVHLCSGATYGKGFLTIAAPIGQIPVFVRKESPFFNLLIRLKELF